jgi:hypothetical protein
MPVEVAAPLIAFLAIAALGGWFLYSAALSQMRAERVILDQTDERLGVARNALTEIRRAVRDPRAEILVEDWSAILDSGVEPDDPDRFRWAVFRADRVVQAAALDTDMSESSGDDLARCLASGNAPTRADAEMQALAWVSANEPASPIVIPVRSGRP